MRGLPDWNFAAFDAAEERWRKAGHWLFSPAQTCRALGYDYDVRATEVDGAHLRHVIATDFACIMTADALALLPGWESSTGATVELALAQFLLLPIYDAVTMEMIHPSMKPWRYDPRTRYVIDDSVDGYSLCAQRDRVRREKNAHQDAEREHGLQGVSDRDSYRPDPDLAVQ